MGCGLRSRVLGADFGRSAATAERKHLVILCYDRDYLGIAAGHGQPVKIITET
jgi:predicted nuclease of predicted toxin-antitoxin system